MLNNKKIFALLMLFSLISGILSIQFIQESNSNADLLVTMEAEKPTNVQVASSDWSNQRNTLYGGKGVETLSFKNVRVADQMILKASFVPNNLVKISSIEFTKRGKTSYRLMSYDVVSIDPNVNIISSSPNLQFINTLGYAQLILNLEINQSLSNRYISDAFSIFREYDFTPFLAIAILFFLMLSFRVASLRIIMFGAFAQLLIFLCLIYFACRILLDEYGVTDVIGKGAYLGLNPKLYSQISVITGGIYLITSLIRTYHLGNTLGIEVKKDFLKVFSLPSTIFFVISFIVYLPKILSANQNAKLSLGLDRQPSWDLENVQSWEGLFRQGWDPNLDFWYPYGSRIFLNQYPTLLELLYYLIFVFITIGVSLYLFPRFKNRYLGVAIQVLLFITLISIVSDPVRLGLPILGVFAIASAKSFSNVQIWVGLFWTLICVLFGSDVFVYWLVSLFVYHLSLTLSTKSVHNLRSYFNDRIATFHLLHLLGLVFVFLACSIHPFSRQIIALALSSTKAGEASSDPVVPLSPAWLIWSSLLILNCIMFWMITRLEFFKFNGIVLSAIFATSILHLAKMGARPIYWIYSFDAVILASTLCVMLFFQFALQNRIFQFCAGFLIGIWLCFPAYNLTFEKTDLWKSLSAELRGEFRDPKVDYQNFSNYESRDVLLPFTSKRFYVYGDSGYIYVMAGQKPYWQINLYNSAFPTDQNRVISELRNNKPKYVIVDLAALNFDLVPHYMRNPQLLQYVLTNFKIEKKLNDQYWILVSRKQSEVSLGNDVSDWTDIFGTTIDLGWVGTNYQGKSPHISCGNQNNYCDSKLIAQNDELVRELNFMVESKEFRVRLSVSELSDDFKIPVDFIWPIASSKNFDTFFAYETIQERE
jgi:hypothetical protein